MAVLVLQSFPVKCGAARRCTDQKPPRLAVTSRPGQVAYALETEHGVKDVERHHRITAGTVGGRRCDPGREGTGFIDALFQDLSLLVFLVEHDLPGVLRRVALANGRVDTQLAKHTLHSEGAGLIGYDGHNALANMLVLDQGREQAHERHRGGDFPLAATLELVIKGSERRRFQQLKLLAPGGNQPTQLFSPLHHIAHFRAVRCWPVIRHILEFGIRYGNAEAVAECFQAVEIELLQRVGLVVGLARLACAVTFDGHRQNHCGALVLRDGLGIGCIEFVGIVTAAIEVHDVFVRQVLNQFQGFRVLAEEMLPGVGATVIFVVLQLAIADLVHALLQQPAVVFLQQRIPLAPPDHLEHIPARTAEYALQLLNDLAVAAHRPVQPLQVAVDHKNEIAEALPPGHGNSAQRLRLVALTIAEETPHVAIAMIDKPAALLVLHHVGLVDGLNGAQPHGHRGELPIIGHQPGVGVGGQAVAIDLATEVIQLLLCQPAFQIGAGVHAGGTVSLVEHKITGMPALVAAEEVVETHIVQGSAGGKRGNVTTQPLVVVICAHHHGQCIPAHQGPDTTLHEQIARHQLLVARCDGVAEGRGNCSRQAHAGLGGVLGKLDKQLSGALRPAVLADRVQRVHPFPCFDRVLVFGHAA